jgi:hypothetical protein
MRLIQVGSSGGDRSVGIVIDSERVDLLAGDLSIRELALRAIDLGISMEAVVRGAARQERRGYSDLVATGALLPPIDHPDSAHTVVTGTGLTHLGSADARDRMHKADEEELTDSMRMFRSGIEGGKPNPGEIGFQPEWFYKGDGSALISPYGELPSPSYALGDGEEPEVAGIYVIGPDSTPYRIGYALGNEYSDHTLERSNYLNLAHSKLRPFALGPELLLGELPSHVQGWSRIIRRGEVVWEKTFVSGEENMSHSIANLEHHHFKYGLFRRPGDVHIHFFGTATLSCADGVEIAAGDEIEIGADVFGRPLRNRVARLEEGLVAVRKL